MPATVDERLAGLPDLNDLQERAQTSRPDLASLGYLADAAQARVNLARKDYFPDFKVSLLYGLRDGNNPDGSERTDFASVLFSMDMPIFNSSKRGRAVDQRNAEWMNRKYQLTNQRNTVASEVSQAVSDYQNRSRQVALIKDEIVPRARQVVEAMLVSYQVSKVDFGSLVRSQTRLLNLETEYWKAFSSANQTLAQLEAAVGGEIFND